MASTHREVRRRGSTGSDGSVLLRHRYDDPIHDVWSACTEPERLGRWFGQVSGELHAGGTVRVDIGEREMLECRILRCEPPRALTVSWAYGQMAPDTVDLRLIEDGAGTVLELEHHSANAIAFAAGGGAGWEDWLFRLATMLRGGDGRTLSSDEIQARLTPAWEAVPVAEGA